MNKKVLFILPVLAMLLAGCNKGNAPQESKEETSTSQSTSTSTSQSSGDTSSEGSQSEGTSSEESSSEETSSEEQSSEEQSSEDISSEETSSEEQSSEEQSSSEQSSEESSSEEPEGHVVSISVGGVATVLTENKEAVIDTEHGQIAQFNGSLTNLVKGQAVSFSLDGLVIDNNIGSDKEDTENKNLVQGEVGNFIIHNDAASSDVTFKVYETGYSFWLTGYVADTPVEDSYKMFVKRGSEISDFDMTQNSEKTTEYYKTGVELEANDEVFFCITENQEESWYHYSDVQSGCISLVSDSEAYIHGDEEDPRSDHNLVIKEAGEYDFYVDTAKAKDTNASIWVAKKAEENPETLKTLYLIPNSNWLEKGHDHDPRFALYAYGGILGEKWYDMTKVTDGVFSVEIDVANHTTIIFCRMNGTTTENNWSNKYNQTNDLLLSEMTGNCYTVTPDTWDNGGGTWSTYGE